MQQKFKVTIEVVIETSTTFTDKEIEVSQYDIALQTINGGLELDIESTNIIDLETVIE